MADGCSQCYQMPRQFNISFFFYLFSVFSVPPCWVYAPILIAFNYRRSGLSPQ
jgi:hypothetical protein